MANKPYFHPSLPAELLNAPAILLCDCDGASVVQVGFRFGTTTDNQVEEMFDVDGPKAKAQHILDTDVLPRLRAVLDESGWQPAVEEVAPAADVVISTPAPANAKPRRAPAKK